MGRNETSRGGPTDLERKAGLDPDRSPKKGLTNDILI